MAALVLLDKTQINEAALTACSSPDLTVVELKRWLCCQKAQMAGTKLEPTTLALVELVKMFYLKKLAS